MPTPTIPAGNLYMNATIYTGNGTSNTVTNGVSGQSFQPDFVWVKNRTSAYNNYLYDSVRGVNKPLQSNLTDAEASQSDGLDAFLSNGYSINGNRLNINASGEAIVAWNWKAGGTAVSNTAGSITSSVSANTTSGFSVVTYTGNLTTGATVGHGLGVKPAFIIIKARSASESWEVWSSALNSGGVGLQLRLNSTSAAFSASDYYAAPTSTTFTLGGFTGTNGSGTTYVAYCWAPIAGYSQFGSYTGNGSADGPFIYTGFRPRYVLIKNTTDSGQLWCLHDTSVNPYNLAATYLAPNNANGDAGSAVDNPIDILSNGFKIRYSNTVTNNSGATMIYMAFAENPFKYANAR